MSDMDSSGLAWRLGRRQVAHLAAAAVAAGCTSAPGRADAQQGAGASPGGGAAAPGLVLPAALPCATHPNDIVGLLLEGIGGQAASVVVFGQAFRPGDLPRGARIAARLAADGRPLRAQLDVTVRHPDGSARHGVVALAAPALAEGARAGVVLSRAAAGAEDGPALDLAAATAGRQAVVEVTPAGGGAPWRADLLALLAAPGAGRAAGRPWQSGPLATQRRVAVPVPPEAAGGVASLRLVADVAARADGTLWADVWLRNDIAMRPRGGPAAYGLRVLMDGREALRAEGVRQHQYQGWGRLLGAAPGGRAAPVPPLVRPDATYLADAGAVARYDQTTGVPAELLAQFDRDVRSPAWAAPLGPRGIERYMPQGGGRFDIGPATGYQAAWLSTGDRRAALFSIGQAEAAGAVPWHLWDPGGGADGRGGWMDARRWPLFWADLGARGGPPPTGLLQPIPPTEETGWTPEAAHQPALSFVPYLLTGRRAFLDGLQAQAAWSVIECWPHRRSPPPTPRGQEGFIVIQGRQQIRSAAWCMREIDSAAWISPEDDPNADYLRFVSARNWSWLRGRLPEWTAAQGETHGWIPPGDPEQNGLLAPWQIDHFASSAAAAARQGNGDARAVLAWMANFLVGRFEASARGFPRNDGIAIVIAAYPAGRTYDRVPYRTWAEIGEQNRVRKLANGEGWEQSQGWYSQIALTSLALLMDVLDLPAARRAYAWLIASGAPNADPANFARLVNWNITPRGMPRVPARAARCAAVAAPRGA